MQKMTSSQELAVIHENIAALKNMALVLQTQVTEFPALRQNIKRILASVKMLEMNLSDALAMDQDAS